jgi:Sulfotransferase family
MCFDSTAQRPLFIVGTGRCGSTLLSEMIRLHPRLLSLSEWFAVLGERRALEDRRVDACEFWDMLTLPTRDAAELLARHPKMPELRAPERLLARGNWKDIAPILLIPLPHLDTDPQAALCALHEHIQPLSSRTLSEWHVTVFSFLARRYAKTVWVERSGGSLAYADALCRMWSNARYIHIYRDGVACSRSMHKHPYFQVCVARAIARSPLPIAQCLQTCPPIEQFGAYWSAVIARGVGVLRRCAREDVLHVSYERLLTEPISVLRRVQRFLEGSTEADEWVEAAKGCIRLSGSTIEGLESTERLRRACRVGMSELARIETDMAA